MNKSEYRQIEAFMLEKMSDSAHDKAHIYRVLAMSLDIAAHERNVDMDILITAALLHDVGRPSQHENPALNHAEVGAEMAYKFLTGIGWEEERAAHVRDCVITHRHRKNRPPETIEAKIIFDSDKLDVTGTIGVARTLIYCGQILQPLYVIENGGILTAGSGIEAQSFIEEYNYKLRNIYDTFQTTRGKILAEERRTAAISFYENIMSEISASHIAGIKRLEELLN